MDMMGLIRTRKSVRTFDGTAVSEEDKEKLLAFARTIEAPFGVPVTFLLLDAKAHGLSSPVIAGETLYLTGKVPQTAHCDTAFGCAFEKLLLYAWSLGLGTTWIGGTMDRARFEAAAGVTAGELMPCVSPVGHPAAKRSFKEIAMRTAIKADKRQNSESLFFEDDLTTPLRTDDPTLADALEAVRLAPSAVNKQPWRIVRRGDAFHFYEKRTLSAKDAPWDVQKVDVGIALCHFMAIAGGTLTATDPQLTGDLVYVATVTR